MTPKRSYSRLAVCILIALLTLTSALAQDQSRALVWANHANINTGRVDPYWSKQIEAIELEDILVGGKSVKIGEHFVAERDWIRDITFRVKNVSGEPVTFVQITLTLPEMKFSPQIPYLAMEADRKTQKPLLPGEEVELRVGSGKLYDWVKDSVAREMELSKISKAAIYFVLAISPKGGEQSGGCVKVTDPRNACPFATP